MKLRVFALDYDGTIATDGRLHPAVRAAIAEVRAQGLVVVLVTGRILADLRSLLGDLSMFDAIVAENGAVTAFPRGGRSTPSVSRCPRTFADTLSRRGVEVRVGECIVELDAKDAHQALAVIHELELPLTLHFNRGRLMVLPPAVSKATGLREALRAMRLSVHNAIGIGDAENDHELLAACEIGVAVSWGSDALKRAADFVIEGNGPEAVGAYLRKAAGGARILAPTAARRHLVVGWDDAGDVVALPMRGRNVLIAGDPRSGKSWVAGLLCEQLILQGYCVCLLDAEGDYQTLEALPGVVLVGGNDRPPSMNELARLLRHADVSVVVDLARLAVPKKRDYVVRALRMLTELRSRTGLPHRIVVDEAHYFLHDPEQARMLDSDLAGYTLMTYRASGLHEDVLAATERVIVTRATDPNEARLLHERWRGDEDLAYWEEKLRNLELDEACLLPEAGAADRRLRRFYLAPRLTHHVRHRHKYLDVPVDHDHAFHLVFDEGKRGPIIGSLQELCRALETTPAERFAGHIRRGDISRWIADVFTDAALAERIGEIEEAFVLSKTADFNGDVIRAIRDRYEVTDDAAP